MSLYLTYTMLEQQCLAGVILYFRITYSASHPLQRDVFGSCPLRFLVELKRRRRALSSSETLRAAAHR